MPAEWLPARTMLRDPHSGQPMLAPVKVRALHIREAYAEKVRAALTRREPAIRDFFDIDHAVQGALFDPRDPAMRHLVAAKLAVAGNSPVDLSPAKVAALEGQREAHLRPVLRASDYEAFDLRRVIAVLEELVAHL